jgi:cobalt-zinc-cadmium efflux system outer membrane protein
LQTLPEIPIEGVPDELDRLSRLAATSRPELRGRLAAIARDEKAVELARKRYYPNVTTGLVYQDMQKTNAVTPKTASGVPNVGLFVGFNLPIYRKRLDAAVCEAQARVSADAQLYEAERDQTSRDVKNLLTQAKVQQNVLGLLRRTNLPNSKQVLKSTASDYRAGNLDYLSLITAWREVLQVELQIAQVETELGKALASLERAVGVDLNQNPPDPAPAPTTPSPFVTPAR